MNILIADDEPPARKRLRQLILDLGGHACIGEAGDGVKALEMCTQLAPEVLLLDIRMPRMDGLEVARHLTTLERPPAVIFVTAFDDFALAAFETNAVHYLVKPVRRQNLDEALDRAAQRRGGPDYNAAAAGSHARSYLSVRSGERLRLIPVSEILCLRATQKYVEIVTVGGRWLTETSLVSLEQEFGERFLRVHRNALVSASAITGTRRTPGGGLQVLIQGLEETVEVSRRQLPAVRKLIKQRQFL